MAMFRVSNSSPLALIRKAEGDNTDSDPKVENDIDPPKKKLKVEEDEEYSTDFGTNPKSYFDEAKSGSESPKSYFDEAKSGSESPNPVFVEREQLKFHYSGLEEEMPFPPNEYELQEYEWLRHVYTHKYDFAMPEESGSESPNPIFVEREQLEFNYSFGIEEMPPLPKEYELLGHVY